MIIDRTQQDVDHAKNLILKFINGTITVNELAEYMAGLKGAYNISDFNRVNAKINQIANLLNAQGYKVIINTTDYVLGNIITEADINNYIANIIAIRNAFYTFNTTPSTPTSYKPYQNANAIEKILVDIEQLINNMLNSQRYANEFYSGE